MSYPRKVSLFLILIFCLIIFCSQHDSNDDTFADLKKAGPVIKIEGDQGYSDYTLMNWKDGTIIDARSAHWKSFMWCVNYHDSACNETAKNNYPIQLGADWRGAFPVRLDLYNYGNCPPPQETKLYWLGGIIEGTAPLEATWRESKGSNGAGITLNALNSTVDGMRMHNLHDPFVPLEGNNFILKNCWISYSRDDAIENDGFAGGLIDDCLFDGCYTFYSARNPKKDAGPQAEAPSGCADGVVRIQNCLIRMQNLPGVHYGEGAGWGNCFKENDPRSPAIELINTIWLLEKPNPGLKQHRISVKPDRLIRSEGNVLIWLGDGEYDAPDGFTVLTGKEGLDFWNRAKNDWIENHPKVQRIKGDPGFTNGSIAIVKDGKPNAIIVVPDDTNLGFEKGALKQVDEILELELGGRFDPNVIELSVRELNEYIEKSTGVSLEIVAESKISDHPENRIFIGPCKKTLQAIDVSSIQPEGFVIKTIDDNIHIAGPAVTELGVPVNGILYGVYEFLERFVGVRWLFPGELGEEVPQSKNIIIEPVDIKQEPVLIKRILRNVKLRSHPEQLEDNLKELGVDGGKWQEFFGYDKSFPWFRRQRLGARQIIHYRHAYDSLYKEYGDVHPDFFALQPHGTRKPSGPCRERLCVSHPDLPAFIAKIKIKEFKANPLLTAASISPNDGGCQNKMCMCERCQSWDPPNAPKITHALLFNPATGEKFKEYPALTDRYFRFYNEVAAIVKQAAPDKYLGVYAYSVYRTPPVQITNIADNIIVVFVSTDNEQIAQWGKLTKNLIIRPNYFNGGRNHGMPRNSSLFLDDVFKTGIRNNVVGYDWASNWGNWGTHGLDYYVCAKLLWNPQRDVQEIVDEYIRAMFHDAAPDMAKYYDVLLKKHGEEQIFSDEEIKSLELFVDQAKQKSRDDTKAYERVLFVAEGIDYLKHLNNLFVTGQDVISGNKEIGDYKRAKQQMIDYLKTKCATWSVATVQNLRRLKMSIREMENQMDKIQH